MKKLKKSKNNGIASTIEAYRSSCNSGCVIKDDCSSCYSGAKTGGTVTVAAQGGTSSCP